MRRKILDFPNGSRINSEQISRVVIIPDRSPSFQYVYLEVYGNRGLIFEGLIDMERVVAAERLGR
jgi:hypothetical protein